MFLVDLYDIFTHVAQVCFTGRMVIIKLLLCLQSNFERYVLNPTVRKKLELCISFFPWWRHQMETFTALLAPSGETPVTVIIPLTKASDAELWWFLWSAPEQMVEQKLIRRWFETPSRCNALYVRGWGLYLTTHDGCPPTKYITIKPHPIYQYISRGICYADVNYSSSITQKLQMLQNSTKVYTMVRWNPYYISDIDMNNISSPFY